MNSNHKESIRITKLLLKQLSISAGQTEKQVAGQITSLLKSYKAKSAFRIIVASGKRSAKPHGYATNKKIRPGELVVVDFGAVYNGWRSDVTRTVIVKGGKRRKGQKGQRGQKRQKRILRIIKAAQVKAIKAVKAGVKCCEVDQAAREYIKDRRFGNYFKHSTGHGIGRTVHEAPKLSWKNNHRLRSGQIITIEPGIYIKGWGGVRWEDMVEVTAKGSRLLTGEKGKDGNC